METNATVVDVILIEHSGPRPSPLTDLGPNREGAVQLRRPLIVRQRLAERLTVGVESGPVVVQIGQVGQAPSLGLVEAT